MCVCVCVRASAHLCVFSAFVGVKAQYSVESILTKDCPIKREQNYNILFPKRILSFNNKKKCRSRKLANFCCLVQNTKQRHFFLDFSAECLHSGASSTHRPRQKETAATRITPLAAVLPQWRSLDCLWRWSSSSSWTTCWRWSSLTPS